MKPLPNRICDYFVLLDYNYNSPDPPSILTRFPFEDHDDLSFPKDIANFCFPYGEKVFPQNNDFECHSFIMTKEDGQKIYSSCLVYKTVENGYHAMCLTSSWPFYSNHINFLKETFHYTINPTVGPTDYIGGEPMERILAYYINEIPIPPCGKIAVKAGPFGTLNQIFKRSPPNKLELLYFNFFGIFENLNILTIIKVFEAMLNEKKILIISSEIRRLNDAAESLKTILFPFLWRHIFIPLLPKVYDEYLFTPIPFICGFLKEQMSKKLLNEDIFIVDIDENEIINEEKISLVKLPTKPLNDLIKKLNKHLKGKTKKQNSQKTQPIELLIRHDFMQFFCDILKNYQSFISYRDNINMFNKDEFIESQNVSNREFYEMFFNTQIFECFIQDAYDNLHQEKLVNSKILLFNEHIKQNKKNSEFLKDTSMDHEQIEDCGIPTSLATDVCIMSVTYNAFPILDPNKKYYAKTAKLLTTEFERMEEGSTLDFMKDSGFLKKKILESKCVNFAREFSLKQTEQFKKILKYLSITREHHTIETNRQILLSNELKKLKLRNTETLLDELLKELFDMIINTTSKEIDCNKKITSRIEVVEPAMIEISEKIRNIFDKLYELENEKAKEKFELERLYIDCKKTFKENSRKKSIVPINLKKIKNSIIYENKMDDEKSKSSLSLTNPLLSKMNYNYQLIDETFAQDYYTYKVKKDTFEVKELNCRRLNYFIKMLDGGMEEIITVLKNKLEALEKYQKKLQQYNPQEEVDKIFQYNQNIDIEITNYFCKEIYTPETLEKFSQLYHNDICYNIHGKKGLKNVVANTFATRNDTINLVHFIKVLSDCLAKTLKDQIKLINNYPKFSSGCLFDKISSSISKYVRSKYRFYKTYYENFDKNLNKLNKEIIDSNNTMMIVKYNSKNYKIKQKLIKEKIKALSLEFANATSAKEIVYKKLLSLREKMARSSLTDILQVSNEVSKAYKNYKLCISKIKMVETNYNEEKKHLKNIQSKRNIQICVSLLLLSEKDKKRYLCIKEILLKETKKLTEDKNTLQAEIDSLENFFNSITEDQVLPNYINQIGGEWDKESNRKCVVNYVNKHGGDLDILEKRITFVTDKMNFITQFFAFLHNTSNDVCKFYKRSNIELLSFTSQSSQLMNSSIYNIVYTSNEMIENTTESIEKLRNLFSKAMEIKQLYIKRTKTKIKNIKYEYSKIQDEIYNHEKFKNKSKNNKNDILKIKVQSDQLKLNKENYKRKLTDMILAFSRIEKETINDILQVSKKFIALERNWLDQFKFSIEKIIESLNQINRIIDYRVFLEKYKTPKPISPIVLKFLEDQNFRNKFFLPSRYGDKISSTDSKLFLINRKSSTKKFSHENSHRKSATEMSNENNEKNDKNEKKDKNEKNEKNDKNEKKNIKNNENENFPAENPLKNSFKNRKSKSENKNSDDELSELKLPPELQRRLEAGGEMPDIATNKEILQKSDESDSSESEESLSTTEVNPLSRKKSLIQKIKSKKDKKVNFFEMIGLKEKEYKNFI